jgi:hypothetical protein
MLLTSPIRPFYPISQPLQTLQQNHAECLGTLLSDSPGSSSRATAAALNAAVYRLRVFFVMTFLQMVSQTTPGLAG